MKKVILISVALVALVAGYAVLQVGRGFRDAASHGGSDAACERRLAAICKEMNAKLPDQAPRGVRFDSVASGPGRRLTYTYTFVNLSSADIDPADLTAKLKPPFVNTYKTEPKMEEIRKMETEIQVQYRGKEGNVAASFVVSPKDF
jgi:hypothetical protein